MKILFFIFGLLTINACSFGGFQPPPPHDHWRLHNSKVLFPTSDPKELINILTKGKKTCRIAVWIMW